MVGERRCDGTNPEPQSSPFQKAKDIFEVGFEGQRGGAPHLLYWEGGSF